MRHKLIRWLKAVALSGIVVSSVCSAALKAQELGTIRWQDMDASAMKVTYFQMSNGRALKIAPSVPYLDLLRTGKPITAIHFWWSPFEWTVPELSVKTGNSTDHSVLLNNARITVQSSKINETPIPIFFAGTVRELAFFNDGWGPLLDARLTYGSLDDAQCAGSQTISDNSFKKVQHQRLGDIADRYRVDVTNILTPQLSTGRALCVAGVLTYSDKSRQTWRIPFRTVVLLNPPGPAMPAPPTSTYDLYLEAGKSGYTINLPLSQEVPPKGADNFKVNVFSNKSADFKFTMNVTSSDSASVVRSDVDLTYFRPRSVPEPATPDKVYLAVKINIQQFAPYIAAIKFDPVHPSEFKILATEEWMLLTQSKRAALHSKIQDALSSLNLSQGNYCYQLPEKECVRSGSFRWR